VAPAAPPPTAALAAGPVFRLQLVAVRDEAAALRAWDMFRGRHAGVLGVLEPAIERVETASGVLYRLQAGPFRDRAAAEAACEELKRQNGDCFVVNPRS
jgi:cell division septation protein DedD